MIPLLSGLFLSQKMSPRFFFLKIFMPPPPLEKGDILFCNCRSVGRSVGRSVDQVLSAQYLLTPSLDKYQTWCSGCPQWVDDPYCFSGHMFKGQGQITLLSPLCCLLNIFWPFHLINPKLVQGLPSISWWSQLIFRSHVQRHCYKDWCGDVRWWGHNGFLFEPVFHRKWNHYCYYQH